MNIILLGYRGSGKTTIGKALAEQLWKTFVDVDAHICKWFGGLTIAEIWKQHGEPAFRATEVQVTCELLQRHDQVIALGGGTVMQEQARKAVKDAVNTVRIYLYCEPEELLRRITGDAGTATARPSLTALGGGIEEIKSVLAQRDPVYRDVADKVFDVTHVSADDAVRHIIQRCL